MAIKFVFLVGCPRSGTTWLQLLLAQHPQVATLEETHVFSEYVSPLLLRRRRNRDPNRKAGLDAILDDGQFRDICRDFVLSVLDIAMADKPGATLILEKTPSHLFFAQDILELFPDAFFVHIIRDPRAVVASLLDAEKTFGRRWAPRSAHESACMWRDAILQGKRLQHLTNNHTDVSYEAVVNSPVSELARLLDVLGVPADAGFCERAVAACAKDNLRAGSAGVWAPKSMKGNLVKAVRRAEDGSWQAELSRLQVISVEKVTAGLMEEYGYTPVALRNGVVPPYWYVYRGLERIRQAAGRSR